MNFFFLSLYICIHKIKSIVETSMELIRTVSATEPRYGVI